MDLVSGNEIRPEKASMQEQREKFLGLKNKFRWRMRQTLSSS